MRLCFFFEISHYIFLYAETAVGLQRPHVYEVFHKQYIILLFSLTKDASALAAWRINEVSKFQT